MSMADCFVRYESKFVGLEELENLTKNGCYVNIQTVFSKHTKISLYLISKKITYIVQVFFF